MVRDLGLPIEKIHACKNGCMLYWKDDIDMEYCKFCGDPTYKPTRDRNPLRKKFLYAILRYFSLTPRLQRLYGSPTTAEHMILHANHVMGKGSICHPFDAEVWRHFDRTHPNFALEPRNVRLGLCRDGFAPTGSMKRKISGWVKCLRFPNGYVSNLARCVNMTELRLHGMKSHVCHIFMQKLIPIAFRDMVPEHVWSALMEVSLLFQILCFTTLDVRKVQELEDSVAVIMCNLEKVFHPAFFYSMEHLNLHLSNEDRLGDPVQYRWMYPFERFLRELKKKVKNKIHVEASIIEAYIVEKN
ncbi:hypothetical protein Sango_1924000 [Sesamum angolense]|uniref:DUF4218 domain-containing protein n=1 Tax=Sesamum angolense TaxID=2727404 RepID=A0AAE1WDT4_9LAMI|nr:hypothetical protein Sango_1924000 [Sesamum angolense]